MMANRLLQLLRQVVGVFYKKTSYTLWAPIIALGMVFLWELTPLAQRLENDSVDLRFRARAPFDPPADPRLVFVGIDQPTLDHIGAWPFPRDVEADFLSLIAGSGMNPSTVAFDVLLTDDYDKFNDLKTGQEMDKRLGDAAGLLPSVITGAFWMGQANTDEDQQLAEKRTQAVLAEKSMTAPFTDIHGDIKNLRGSNAAVFPVAPLRAQSFFGFVNAEPSSIDGIRHTLPILVRVADKVYPSLTLQVLCQMLNIDPDKVHVVLGQSVVLADSAGKTWTIPINEKGEATVNYRDNSKFNNLAFYKLLDVLKKHYKQGDPIPPQCDIDKKALLVAGAAIGLADLGNTPLAVNVPLGYTHLNLINNVLRNDYLHFVPKGWVILGWLITTWATLIEMRRATIFRAVLVPFLIVVLYTVITFGLFWRWSYQIELAWPLLAYAGVNFGAVILRWLEESRGREQVKKTFAQMVSPDLMNHLLDDPSNLNLGGSKRAVTILFSDIRSFTTLSESTENQELVRQLNRYFDRMVRCILDYRGTLHGFTGDGIMAVWGDVASASSGVENDAINAIRSALNMRRRLVDLNEERAAENLPPLRIGIGLNHGTVVVGLMGASIRTQFSCVGDSVNTASRIEGLTKQFHADLAIGENLRALIGDTFLVRRLGRIQLKGKTKAILAYEVLAESEKPGESNWKPDELAQYESAFDYFLARRFAEAEAGFLLCQAHHPQDHCVAYYLKASRSFRLEAPPENWDGRVVMETK